MTKLLVDVADLYGIEEAADQLGIGRATLFRWIKANKISPVKISRRTLIPKYEIERAKLALKK